MTNSWLPTWLGVVWVALMAVVLVVHVRHLLTLPDLTRAWHAGHVLMASGMAVMFWPGGTLLTPTVGVVGRTVFALAAVAAAVWAVVDRRRRGSWTTVWPLLVVDLGAMVWMFAVMAPTAAGMAGAMGADGSMSMGPWWVNALLAAWFAVEAVRWATGSLVRSVERDLHLELPGEVLERADAPAGPSAGPDAGDGDGDGDSDSDSTAVAGTRGPSARRSPAPLGQAGEAAPRTPAGVHAWHGASLRVTLTIMSAGMAYMLAAMAFGASSMGGMGGMGGM